MKNLLKIISLDLFCTDTSNNLRMHNPPKIVTEFIREEMDVPENDNIQSIDLVESGDSAAMKILLTNKQ